MTSGLIIDTEPLTMADVFKRKGYATAALGKWHLEFGEGKNDWKEPLRQGPQVLAPFSLDTETYDVVMGRMGAGTDSVKKELFINNTTPVDVQSFSVNTQANASKMVIGQERDATNHPGVESFDGNISRVIMFNRPLNDEELLAMSGYLMTQYRIDRIK